MFGSVVLEVASGLVLSFLLFSIILTSLREGVEGVLKSRARMLEATIGELLDEAPDKRAQALQAFFDHPVIAPLFQGAYAPASLLTSRLPSYIRAHDFARATHDLYQKGAITSQQLGAIVGLASTATGGQSDAVIASLENWYDSAMERLSGRYQRYTRLLLFVMALMAAAAGNINAIHIADALASNQQMRENLAALTPEVQKSLMQADSAGHISGQLKAVHLPVGWSDNPFGDPGAQPDLKGWAYLLGGWVVTALAGMLGAPFWFDVLNKFMNFRSTSKPGATAGQSG